MTTPALFLAVLIVRAVRSVSQLTTDHLKSAKFIASAPGLGRWPRVSDEGKTLETLIEEASRARRFAIVLEGDPAASNLEQYAEELGA